MAGRAGRRGIDSEGFVYSRINPHRITYDEVKKIIYGKPEEVRSQFNTSYATLLNLYEKYKDQLFNIYPQSLHYYQTKFTQQKEAVRLMESKLKILKEWGFIQNDALTDKGHFAKAVYGYELILSELYQDRIFEDLDESGLAIMAVATVFEPRKHQFMPSISHNANEIKRTCEAIFEDIEHKERNNRIYPLSKMPYFNLSKATDMWVNQAHFAQVLKATDTDEGEVVRYFRMAIQILREISDTPISPALRDRIWNTIRLMNRDIVDAEKQLRES
jgi:superfamily II RNA helicase